MDKHPNIDAMIDWPEFYGRYISAPMKPSGTDKMLTRCPLGTHDDKHESFWFRPSNGLFKCEACGASGNATTFLAHMEGISTGEAYKRLCEMAGVSEDKSADPKGGQSYTVKEYALEKRLPADFLQSLGVRDGRGNRYIELPYMDEHNRIIAIRKRMPKGSEQRFLWNKGDRPTLYGLWRMEDIRSSGYVILVEGESDSQTLWYLGRSALGFPGSTNFNVDSARKLLDIPEIYLHVEPDNGGRIAKRKVAQALLDAGYRGIVRPWSCAAHNGCKDPSQLYITEGDKASEIIRSIMAAATPMNLQQAAMGEIKGLEDAPVKLRVPDGYELDAGGIYAVDPKTGNIGEVPFCWTPILIIRQLCDMATVERKVQYAFKDHTGWVHGIAPRDMLATTRSITKLAVYGADVTSENAAAVVKWIAALERANGNLIEHQRCIGQYGWIDGEHFAPCALGSEYVFDGTGWGRYGNVGKASGTLAEWVEAMRPNRRNSIFRFILAASFAAPLLKIVRERIFIVYNWGDSKGGKTAALYAALSAWGDPQDLIASFNTTNVAAERIAGLFSDLPLGLNERQLAAGKQDFLDKLIYQLAEGSGKTRGMREGGLQQQVSWRNIVIANGEEPLTGDASQTGTTTRALEVFGKPFDNEEAASQMYTATAKLYGSAGPAFVERLIKADKAELRSTREKIMDTLRDRLKFKQRNHVTYMATVCLADWLIDQWLFGNEAGAAYEASVRMAGQVFGTMDVDDVDVNKRAYEFICGWAQASREQFTDDYKGITRFGYLEAGDSSHVLVFPTVLDDALKNEGFNPRKTRRWLISKRVVETTVECGRIRDLVRRQIDGQRMRLVRLNIDEDVDAVIDFEKGTEMDGYTEVDDPDMPFD